MTEALDAANRLIRQRRTLKQDRMDPLRPVDRAVLDAMFENANHAPTHGLTEPWRFRVYESEASRRELAENLQRIYRETTPEEKWRAEKVAKLGAAPLLAPVVVVICMVRQETGQIPEIEEIAAVACAVQNMHLTASAVGLGAKWSSPPVCYTRGMKAWLGLRAEDKCLGLFYIGWPMEGVEWPQASPRRPIGEKVSFC
jgi:nitroreductase